MPKQKWRDLTQRQQTLVLAAASVQLSLAATAFTDLARRPASQVNGWKIAWIPVIMVNTIGPIAYFVFGIRRDHAQA
ncbi:MAG: PLD nuclease N-terminal domain-containing protein [Actinomycetota bacterium]|nr:PLD nuclease N-terminal domain-containing protein [Actinomycetota bacterium]